MPAATMLDSNHHTFLQAVMKRGPLTEKAAQTMYKALVRSNGADFGEFLLAINKELEFLRFELKKVMNQYDGKVFYGIINSLPSKEAKLGTQFSQAQILFFTAVMEAIVQEPTASGVITSTSAMYLKLEQQVSESQSPDANTQTGSVKMTMQAREEAVDLLVSEQFLRRTEDGGLALGVKAFLELRSVFRTLEVPFCDICNEAAIKAQMCSTRDCSKRLHSYCIARGSSQSRNQVQKCPGCNAAWAPTLEQGRGQETEEEYVEPIATPEETLTQDPVHISGRMRGARRKRSALMKDHDYGENSGHHEEEVDSLRSSRTSRSRH